MKLFSPPGIVFLFIFLLANTTILTAQTASLVVSGTVSNEAGKGLEGVTVTVKGTAASAVSGPDGTYKITAGANDALMFSYVGAGCPPGFIHPKR